MEKEKYVCRKCGKDDIEPIYAKGRNNPPTQLRCVDCDYIKIDDMNK